MLASHTSGFSIGESEADKLKNQLKSLTATFEEEKARKDDYLKEQEEELTKTDSNLKELQETERKQKARITEL